MMPAMAGLLSLERREEVAVVTLQRPEKRNALSIDLRVELADAFGGLGDDPDVGALVLTGAPPAFSSGMDTSQFGGDRANRERLVETSIRCFRAVGNCPKPVVAAVKRPDPSAGPGSRRASAASARSATARSRLSPPSTDRRSPGASRWPCSATCA